MALSLSDSSIVLTVDSVWTSQFQRSNAADGLRRLSLLVIDNAGRGSILAGVTVNRRPFARPPGRKRRCRAIRAQTGV